MIYIYIRNITVRNVHLEQKSSFVCPTTGNVSNCVAATAEHQQRNAKALHKLDTTAVALSRYRQI